MGLGWLFLAAVGCGSGGRVGQPVAQFPSKAKLEEVAARPATPKSTLKTLTVDRWQMETNVPAPGATYPRENHWDELLLSSLDGRSEVRASAELRCAAREAARFYVQHGAYPDDSLRAFLLLRCGSTAPVGQIQTMFGDVPPGTTEAAIESGFDKSAKELIKQLSQASELGLGFASANGRATLVALSAKPPLRLNGFTPTIAGSSAVLQGEARDAGFVTGFVSNGGYGVKFCEPDRRLKMPAFRLECPIAESDAEVTVELVTGKPNQLFWHLAARAQLRRDANAGLAYEGLAIGRNETLSEPRAFGQAFLAGLNQVRKEVGIPELGFEAAQSSTNERLLPHFFDNAFKGNEWMIEEIGLGLLAGWDVNGMIRTGGIFSSVSSSSRNPGRFLADALKSPFARWVLLEPEMTRVAIGAGALEPSGAMALITTYAFFDSQDHRADEAKVFQEFDKARRAHGVPPPRLVIKDGALLSALTQVANNALPSDAALQEAMRRIAQERSRGVSGYVFETSDLHHLEFPDELLRSNSTEVQIGVTHYRARGGAWGQYAVMFIFLEGGGPNTATAGTKAKL